VIGDPAYGARPRATLVRIGPAGAEIAAFSRQALHARLLGFSHPATGEALRFESALPADMARLISNLELL
jgi:23S rRNA pseudouridine1911/1915/1917 synthase